MRSIARFVALAMILGGCSSTPPENDYSRDAGSLWVKHSAEYRALALQAYALATDDIARLVADTGWSAVPDQADAAGLPPAVILDVDETVVSNVDFQLTFERPFANYKLDEWTRTSQATPVPGVAEFVAAARAAGATVFFVTNRPCERVEGIDDPCPQKQTTIEDIDEAGIVTDADHVLLSEERGWNREKVTRRQYIAQRYRIVMLVGDDLGDFIPCVRSKAYPPCTTTASADDRERFVDEYAAYWGNGWYVLPNPMHGSWTSTVPD